MSTYYEQWGYADPPVDKAKERLIGIGLEDAMWAAGMADRVFHVKHENAVSWGGPVTLPFTLGEHTHTHTITPARRALDGPWEERLYGARHAPAPPSWELVENLVTMRAGWFRPPYLRPYHD